MQITITTTTTKPEHMNSAYNDFSCIQALCWHDCWLFSPIVAWHRRRVCMLICLLYAVFGPVLVSLHCCVLLFIEFAQRKNRYCSLLARAPSFKIDNITEPNKCAGALFSQFNSYKCKFPIEPHGTLTEKCEFACAFYKCLQNIVITALLHSHLCGILTISRSVKQ